jgi:hypothetical protein
MVYHIKTVESTVYLQARAMPCVTSKSWKFTIYGEDLEAEIEWLKTLEFNVMTCSKEVCPDTENLHLQGAVTWKRSYSLAALKKLHAKAHWEIQKCVQDNNYERKRGSEVLIDQDNRKKKGARTDIENIKTIVKSSGSMRDVVEAATSVQSIRMAEIWLKYCEAPRPISPAPAIHWRWGTSGVGKTREIWDTHDINEVFTPVSYKWWEGYDGHKVVLIDELRGDWCTFGQLLKITDRYPFRVETKGGSRQMLASEIWITSCKPPELLYNPNHFDSNERVDQLTRRITTITEVTK